MAEPVGIVLVSHSDSLATGLRDMLLQIGAANLPVATAGGTDDGRLGTSYHRIGAAIASVDKGSGVAVLTDAMALDPSEHGHDLEGAALASDAFFPFPDGPRVALEAGVKSIIQPGGSKRDADVVAAVEDAGAVMVFTSRRHFRH